MKNDPAEPQRPIPAALGPVFVFAALLLAAAVFVFRDYLLLRKVWLFKDIGSDSVNLEYPHLVLMARLFRDSLLPGWSFSQGLGQNMLPLMLGGNFTGLLFPFSGDILVYGMAWAEFLKVLLAGLFFWLYLGQLRLGGAARAAGGIMYAFSGYMAVGGGWSIFSYEAMCVALLLYAFERWFRGGGRWLLPLPFALLGLAQPFYWYTCGALLFFYAGLRWYAAEDRRGRGLLNVYLEVYALCALGAAASALFSLPSIWQMSQSPRLAGGAGYFKLLLSQPFSAVARDEALTTLFRFFSSDLAGTGREFRGAGNYLEAAMVYSGLPALLLLPQFFAGESRRRRLAGAAALLLCALPLAFPLFRRMFWLFTGDYYRTLSLFVSLCPLILSVWAADALFSGRRKTNLALLAAWLAALLCLLYFPWTALKPEAWLRDRAAALLCAYALIAAAARFPRLLAPAAMAFPALVACEAALFSSVTVNQRPVVTRPELAQRIGYNDRTKEAVDWLNAHDRGFYRVAKNYSSGVAMHASINDAMVFGYKGTSSYNPFNQQSYVKFLGEMGITDTSKEVYTRWLTGLERPFRPLPLTFVSVKYAVTRDPAKIGPFGYRPLYQAGDVFVLENAFALPLGFTYSAYMPHEDFLKVPMQQRDLLLLFAAVTEAGAEPAGLRRFKAGEVPAQLSFADYDKAVKALKAEALSLTRNTDNLLAGTITLKKPKLLFFSIPYDKGWRAKVDGRPVPLAVVNVGFMGLRLEPGGHTVELAYEPPMKYTGMAVSSLALLLWGGLFYRSRRNGARQGKNGII